MGTVLQGFSYSFFFAEVDAVNSQLFNAIRVMVWFVRHVFSGGYDLGAIRKNPLWELFRKRSSLMEVVQ